MLKKQIQVQIECSSVNKNDIQRKKDELAIQQLTTNWQLEELDTPEKIKKWVKH